MPGQQDDLRRLQALHRQVLARLVKRCLQAADPDLQEFAATLPAAVDSVEGHLKRFWARKGFTPDRVRDFAVRYGRALGACPEFQTFEARMAELGRLAGQPGFAERLAAVAQELGVVPESLG